MSPGLDRLAETLNRRALEAESEAASEARQLRLLGVIYRMRREAAKDKRHEL